ncbi:MAG: DUF721 domain-containing protein [Gammaproteobacteria bacterium]|nr:DUF721 domain-containing protein [Gammaproteobacteria bacterium]
MNKPLKVNKLLRSGPLSPLLARARGLVALDEQVHALLPVPLQPHCHVLSLHDRILVLAADSPVWAARLRFHAPKLVKQLSRQQTVAVRTVRVRVRPPEKTITSARKKPSGQKQGHRRAAELKQAAQTVSDPRLKSALLKLSRR